MAELIRVFKRVSNRIFGIGKSQSEPVHIFNSLAKESTVLKTRTQLISEGKGAHIPKRHIHGTPTLNKHN